MLHSSFRQQHSSIQKPSGHKTTNSSILQSPSKILSLAKNQNDLNRSSQISPSLLLRSKFAKYNDELLLPRCLQKSFTRKITLESLAETNQKSQIPFKLRNYFKLQERPFDSPQYTEEDEPKNYDCQKSQNQFSQFRDKFLKNNPFQQDNKQNLSFENQLSLMMITKSKLKYSPRDSLRQTKTNWANQISTNMDQNAHKVQNSLISRTSSMKNFSKYSVDRRENLSSKEPKELLNSTRIKLLSSIEKTPVHKITKKDIFPLEKLMEKRSIRTTFRNKWFTKKSLQNKVIQE